MTKTLIRCGAIVALLVSTTGCLCPCLLCFDPTAPTIRETQRALPEIKPIIVAGTVDNDVAAVVAGQRPTR